MKDLEKSWEAAINDISIECLIEKTFTSLACHTNTSKVLLLGI